MPHHMQFEDGPGGTKSEVPSAVDCGDDPVRALKEMFVDVVMGKRLAAGQAPALRPVFWKTHGVASGRFTVRADLPEDLQSGLFQPGEFPAMVRFSCDSPPNKPDVRNTVGVAMKLFDVPGEKLLHTDASTCDFLMQNHDVFFVDTAREMCEFTYAGLLGEGYPAYLAKHPKTDRILKDMEKVVPSVLRATYWGLLPHALGDTSFVKYKLAPAPGSQDFDLHLDPEMLANCLYVDLRTRLLRAPAEFRFYVQVRTDDEAMPLDRATVRWDEAASPPVHVATLALPRQDIDALGRAELSARTYPSISGKPYESTSRKGA